MCSPVSDCQRILPALISTESGEDIHWHNWSWVPDQMAKLVYSPLMLSSPLSLFSIPSLSFHCTVPFAGSCLLTSYFLFIYLKPTKHSFQLFHSFGRGCYPASSTAISFNSVSHLGVPSGHLTGKRRRLTMPSYNPWAAYSWYQLDPAVCTEKLLLSCCAYEIICGNTVNKSCLSLSLFCI